MPNITDDRLDSFFPQGSSQWDAFAHFAHPTKGGMRCSPTCARPACGARARIVAGVTEKTSAQRRRGMRRDKAACHARSVGV